MRYQTAQILELLGITKEALRHWKRVLGPITGRDGRSEGYDFEEVVALAVIAEANRELSVPISRFASVAHRLFEDIGHHVVSGRADVVVCISRGDVALHPIDGLPTEPTLAIVRLEPVVRRLRARLFSAEPDAQLALDLEGRPLIEAADRQQGMGKMDIATVK